MLKRMTDPIQQEGSEMNWEQYDTICKVFFVLNFFDAVSFSYFAALQVALVRCFKLLYTSYAHGNTYRDLRFLFSYWKPLKVVQFVRKPVVRCTRICKLVLYCTEKFPMNVLQNKMDSLWYGG